MAALPRNRAAAHLAICVALLSITARHAQASNASHLFGIKPLSASAEPDRDRVVSFLTQLAERNLAAELRPCPCTSKTRVAVVESMREMGLTGVGISAVPLFRYSLRFQRIPDTAVPWTPVQEVLLLTQTTPSGGCRTLLLIGAYARDLAAHRPADMPFVRPPHFKSSQVLFDTEILGGDPAGLLQSCR